MTGIKYRIPEYILEENEKEIIVTISAPLPKCKEAAFVLEKNTFSFDCPPYLLKLKLGHPVYDRYIQQAYDHSTEAYKIKLKKNFEIFDESSDEEEDEISSSTTYSNETASNDSENKKEFYGFANKYSNMFGKFYNEFSEVISLPNPDFTNPAERRRLREKEEDEQWSDDHYLADTMETDHLHSIFSYKPPWIASPVKGDFSADEKELLSEILAKSKVDDLSEENVSLSEFQIVDILFGYAYNKRTTEGDNTVESGWTINKLSSTFCWFEVFEDLKSVLLSCFSRSLIFPLYRNWELTELIQEDVANILQAGHTLVTRCLLEVREVFNDSENRYILNSLYVNDLCAFAAHMSDSRCLELGVAVNQVKIRKCEVNSDLEVLEVAAKWALLEAKDGIGEREFSEIASRIRNLNLGSNSSPESESESDSESEVTGSESDRESESTSGE